MGIQFTTTSAESTSHGVKCLLYGDAGAGKTILAATCPAPIILSAESGLLSLSPTNIQKVYGGAVHISTDIPVIPIKQVSDIMDAYQWFQTDASLPYQTIYIDSLSEIAEVILAAAKLSNRDIRKSYGDLIEQLERVVRMFRDLPNRNVVFTAKSQVIQDSVGGSNKAIPGMPGSKLAGSLPFFFDEMFYLGVNKDAEGRPYRYLQTQPDLNVSAKDRSGLLESLEAPDLGYIFAKINGQL